MGWCLPPFWLFLSSFLVRLCRLLLVAVSVQGLGWFLLFFVASLGWIAKVHADLSAVLIGWGAVYPEIHAHGAFGASRDLLVFWLSLPQGL